MDEILEQILQFVEARDWHQFHKPKDVAISLNLEAAELLEHFQWKDDEAFAKYLKGHKDEIGDELFDVLYWVLLLSYYLDIDLRTAATRKMRQNELKYPVKQAKGNNQKYTSYQKDAS